MKASDIMTGDPACCTPEDPIERVASLMDQHDCGCIPIVENGSGRVVGVVTDRDIAVRAVGRSRAGSTAAREVMTADPYCCRADDDVRDVERTMADHQVRRVVVVDDGGCCIGMVAQADLARAAERHHGVAEDEFAHVVERISEPSHRELRR